MDGRPTWTVCDEAGDHVVFSPRDLVFRPDNMDETVPHKFNSISRYLDDLLNIDNIHFEHMVHRIYYAELQLIKANASDIEVAFLDFNLSIHNDIVSTKI